MSDVTLMADDLYVYSGKVRLCSCGRPAGFKDIADDPLFTGDIVITYTDSYGPQWLTVIVSEGDETYPMGLKTVPMDEPGQWRVKRLKEFKDVVAGEHWPAWGFSYGR